MAQSLDIATILKQQAEILKLLHGNMEGRREQTTTPVQTNPVSTVHSVTHAEGQINQPPVNQPAAQPTADESVQGTEGHAVQPDHDQDPGLVSALNLAFTVDPNSGSEIDDDIARFIENCLNLPNALDWEDMKIIREVYKRPKNCPSIGVPKVPDTLGITLSQAGKDRDKAMCFAQSWVMAGLSAMGKIASDLKPHEMDSSVPWVRPVYAKALDMIRILAHLSVNEISKRRKLEVKAFLPNQYKKLANPKPVVPEIPLFGEELSEDVRECDEQAKVANKLRSLEYYRGRFQPYRRKKGRSRFAGSAMSNRQYQDNWVGQQQPQQNQAQPFPNQGFQQAVPPPAPPRPFQYRPYRGRGRNQGRRGRY